MLPATQIIKRHLVTEKCTWESAARNRYGFWVDIHANKKQIAAAIAAIYNVRVEKVSTQVRKGHNRRTRYGVTYTGDWKKAVVQLHPEDKLDLY